MIDHIGIGVSDYAASKAFFLKALQPLGVTVVMEAGGGGGIGTIKPTLWLTPVRAHISPIHLAFEAANRAQVDAFYVAAIAAGGKDNGKPGLRPDYHPDYYGAFVIGPDGHNLEMVCHSPA